MPAEVAKVPCVAEAAPPDARQPVQVSAQPPFHYSEVPRAANPVPSELPDVVQLICEQFVAAQ